MKILKHYIIIGLLFMLFACDVSPKPINYGIDGCQFCKMTIVDDLHAAEIVTKKGKVYKFDATECMVNYIKDYDASKVKLYLSVNYINPKELIDATEATFLISNNIPSPMGAYLSAFKNKVDAIKMQSDKGGTVYTWEELNKHLKN